MNHFPHNIPNPYWLTPDQAMEAKIVLESIFRDFKYPHELKMNDFKEFPIHTLRPGMVITSHRCNPGLLYVSDVKHLRWGYSRITIRNPIRNIEKKVILGGFRWVKLVKVRFHEINEVDSNLMEATNKMGKILLRLENESFRLSEEATSLREIEEHIKKYAANDPLKMGRFYQKALRRCRIVKPRIPLTQMFRELKATLFAFHGLEVNYQKQVFKRKRSEYTNL